MYFQVVVLIALGMNGANLYGYLRCKLGGGSESGAFSTVSNLMGKQVITNVSLYLCILFSPQASVTRSSILIFMASASKRMSVMQRHTSNSFNALGIFPNSLYSASIQSSQKADQSFGSLGQVIQFNQTCAAVHIYYQLWFQIGIAFQCVRFRLTRIFKKLWNISSHKKNNNLIVNKCICMCIYIKSHSI